MFGLTKTFVLATLFTFAFVSAVPSQQHHDESIVDWNRLSDIIDSIDTNVLHNVLHNLAPKFRDGVFSKDRAAVEHVHQTDPVMASKLVYMAKRQNNGTTTAAGAGAITRATTTQQTSVAPVVSSAVASQLTASTVPAPTTVIIPPSINTAIETAVSTVPGGVVVSSIGGGVVTRTSSAVGVSFTRSTSTRLVTYTGSNGQLTTSTSLIVVNAPITATAVATGAAGAAATSGDPGLQNAAVQQRGSELTMLVSAALFGVLGFFVAA